MKRRRGVRFGLGALSAAVLVVGLLPRVPGNTAPPPSALVRLNQLGFATGDPFRAFLMSSVDESGATWALRRHHATVSSGSIGADLGAWNAPYAHVYAIDVPAQSSGGSYLLRVDGPADAVSQTFLIRRSATQYETALHRAVNFFQVQRDGPGFIRSALRTAPAHLHDAHAMTYRTPDYRPGSGGFDGDLHPLGQRINAAGGWFDAGDYLKFVQGASYTDAVLLAGVRRFPEQMGTRSKTGYATEALFGARWLMRMWDDRTRTLYFQVGIGSGNGHTAADHDVWRLPQDDDTIGGTDPAYRYLRNRPVFRAGPPGSKISPNLAGRMAAALAQASIVARPSRPALARRYLLAAEHIFALADTHPGKLLTVIPFGFYPEHEWRDDLELGATELATAVAALRKPQALPHVDPMFYLRSAARWAHAYIHGPNDAADTLNLYDVAGLAHYELYRALTRAGNPGGLAVTKAALVADLKTALDAAVAQAAGDPFGFGTTWGAWDSASHGFGLSVMASEYDELTKTSTYAGYTDGWLGNVLGANAWGMSFVIGLGERYPRCPQHQIANMVGSRVAGAPVLTGAVVEGPNSEPVHGWLPHMRACPPAGGDRLAPFNGSGAQFLDNVQSYDNTEPAIDLSATAPLAFARQAAGLR